MKIGRSQKERNARITQAALHKEEWGDHLGWQTLIGVEAAVAPTLRIDDITVFFTHCLISPYICWLGGYCLITGVNINLIFVLLWSCGRESTCGTLHQAPWCSRLMLSEILKEFVTEVLFTWWMSRFTLPWLGCFGLSGSLKKKLGTGLITFEDE